MATQRILVIGGPTASGKSAIAMEVARALDGVVINADSMQVYAELPILTAQPDTAARAAVPHRLYGVLSAAEVCSAARWADMAWAAVDDAVEEGLQPIVVGGTGLYIRAMMRGLAPVPEIPPEIRAETRKLLHELGPAAFHARLAGRDPDGAARLQPTDPQRLARAWEVLEATGRSLADWQAEAGPTRAGAEFLPFVLNPDRETLYQTIDRRFAEMVQAGALDEVSALSRMDLPAQAPALKALGVQELLSHFAGDMDLATAIAAGQQSSRRYAKRQMTWFRNQLPAANFLSVDRDFKTSLERILPEIFSVIRKNC
ncbi:MAG TPA: tRNA (adenosine(37)-N6)-dimethylallyltransferase MiaA [Dongiaceae bacterium]